jgi:head-tail adaptor
MNHKKYKEWMQLFLTDELTQNEKEELLNHLEDCNECSIELEKQKRFYSSLKEISLPEPDQNLLSEARREFNAALRVEKSKRKLFAVPTFNLSGFFFSPMKIAFSGAAVLIVGIFAGYLLFNKEIKPDIKTLQQDNNVDNISTLQGDTRITNVRFIDQDASDGEIEFTADAVKSIHIKGNINNSKIQNILTYSMLYEKNPGVRLNAINVVNTNTAKDDKEIKSALITVAKYDTNLGVRREALKSLRSFPYDSDVREALLYILLNDKNSSMRIEAITSLKVISEKGNGFNQDEISAFRENVNKEDNNFVRYQMKTVLGESTKNEK